MLYGLQLIEENIPADILWLSNSVIKALLEAYKEHNFCCIKVLDYEGALPRDYGRYIRYRIHTKFQDCFTYQHYICICSLRNLMYYLQVLLGLNNISDLGSMSDLNLTERAQFICS